MGSFPSVIGDSHEEASIRSAQIKEHWCNALKNFEAKRYPEGMASLAQHNALSREAGQKPSSSEEMNKFRKQAAQHEKVVWMNTLEILQFVSVGAGQRAEWQQEVDEARAKIAQMEKVVQEMEMDAEYDFVCSGDEGGEE